MYLVIIRMKKNRFPVYSASSRAALAAASAENPTTATISTASIPASSAFSLCASPAAATINAANPTRHVFPAGDIRIHDATAEGDFSVYRQKVCVLFCFLEPHLGCDLISIIT
jgi:hypothetical protein